MSIDYHEEYFIYNADFTSPALPGGTGVTFTDNEVRVDPDSKFNLYSMSHIATSDIFRLEFRDDTSNRYIQKNSVDARVVSGTIHSGITPNGFLPFLWGKPYMLQPGTTFNVRAADASGSSNTVRLSMHGAKVREGLAPWKVKKYRSFEHYVYPINTTGSITLDANATSTASISTDRSADFLVTQLVGIRTAGLLVTIKNQDRGAQWMNTETHFDNLVGNSQFPNRLVAPRFVQGGGVISVGFKDISGSSNTVQLYFIGVKMYE